MNRLSYFITFIVVLTFTSCDAWREKQKKESIRRATEECAQKTHINGFAIYFHDYTKDTLLPIEIKIKHYRNGNTETIRDTVPTQKNYQTYRDYYLEFQLEEEDTVFKDEKLNFFEIKKIGKYSKKDKNFFVASLLKLNIGRSIKIFSKLFIVVRYCFS